MKFNKYWFKPKRFGYGAFPITWEGWVFVLGFIVFLAVLLSYFNPNEHPSMFFSIFIVSVLVLVYVSKIKTKGEWGWRWG